MVLTSLDLGGKWLPPTISPTHLFTATSSMRLPRAPQAKRLSPELVGVAGTFLAAGLLLAPVSRRQRRRRGLEGLRVPSRAEGEMVSLLEGQPALPEGWDPLPEEWQQTQLWSSIWGTKEAWEGDHPEAEAGVQSILEPKKVMILISDTGGGHRASAKALADALEELYPGQLKISIRDVWTERCPWPFNRVVQSYTWMAKHTWSWRFTWFWSQWAPTRWIAERFAVTRCIRAFRREIERENPDLIISVHPGNQHICMKVLTRLRRRSRRTIPMVTVVTDLGSAHPMWFHPDLDRVFVPSDQVKQIALRCGVRESSIHMYGLPLRRAFWKPEPRPRPEVRAALGLVPELQTVLIVGGGDGVGGIQQVAESLGIKLGELGLNAQLAIVCGKNEKVRKALSSFTWPEGIKATVVGFVSNMDEWMAASDVIVTKAGPGTIAEACTRSLPIMLSSFLPGQERGNVSFVVNGGFGDYSKDPAIIARTVAGWLKDPAELERRSKLAYAHGRPHATLQIAQVIGRKWLVTDTGKLATALVAKLRESSLAVNNADHLAEAPKAIDSDVSPMTREAELTEALSQLNEAQRSLMEAQLALRQAKARVRSTLAELTNAPPEAAQVPAAATA